MHRLRALLLRHRWFYTAALIAGLVGFAVDRSAPHLAFDAAGDSFFAAYLLLAAAFEFRSSVDRFRRRAGAEDETRVVIAALTLIAVTFSLVSLFVLLQREGLSGPELVLAVAGAPLGWLMLHTVAAFHYAHVYYARGNDGARPLQFPQTDAPGPVEFLYFSFVIGMTAQTSDVQVVSTEMRKLTLMHGIVSFFYTTVLIAVAVNIAVVLAQRGP